MIWFGWSELHTSKFWRGIHDFSSPRKNFWFTASEPVETRNQFCGSYHRKFKAAAPLGSKKGWRLWSPLECPTIWPPAQELEWICLNVCQNRSNRKMSLTQSLVPKWRSQRRSRNPKVSATLRPKRTTPASTEEWQRGPKRKGGRPDSKKMGSKLL